ncbi:MAG TPA: hypothetical protein VGX78_16790, partial [Pirellulales bacterium]|nr:hypothetical protein [Pirellulales bacterium]
MNDWIFKRCGAHYPLVMMLFTRVVALVGGGLVIYYVNLTLSLDAEIQRHFEIVAMLDIVVAVCATVIMGNWELRDVRRVVGHLLLGEEVEAELAARAGRQVVLFPGRHVVREAIVDPLLCIVPLCAFLWFVDHVPLRVHAHIWIAGFLGISTVLVATFFVCESGL